MVSLFVKTVSLLGFTFLVPVTISSVCPLAIPWAVPLVAPVAAPVAVPVAVPLVALPSLLLGHLLCPVTLQSAFTGPPIGRTLKVLQNVEGPVYFLANTGVILQ